MSAGSGIDTRQAEQAEQAQQAQQAKQALQPAGWAPPKGYANGVAVSLAGPGRQLFLAGQIGWNAQCAFDSDDLVEQVRQALANIRALLAEAGAGPEHLVRLTWYLVDKREYLARAREIGRVYRELVGDYTVAMSAVQVAALVEDRAKVEIEATAVVPGRSA